MLYPIELQAQTSESRPILSMLKLAIHSLACDFEDTASWLPSFVATFCRQREVVCRGRPARVARKAAVRAQDRRLVRSSTVALLRCGDDRSSRRANPAPSRCRLSTQVYRIVRATLRAVLFEEAFVLLSIVRRIDDLTDPSLANVRNCIVTPAATGLTLRSNQELELRLNTRNMNVVSVARLRC